MTLVSITGTPQGHTLKVKELPGIRGWIALSTKCDIRNCTICAKTERQWLAAWLSFDIDIQVAVYRVRAFPKQTKLCSFSFEISSKII